LIQGAVHIAYPMGLPEFDPVQEMLTNTEELGATMVRSGMDGP
jgi:hypothetical protein